MFLLFPIKLMENLLVTPIFCSIFGQWDRACECSRIYIPFHIMTFRHFPKKNFVLDPLLTLFKMYVTYHFWKWTCLFGCCSSVWALLDDPVVRADSFLFSSSVNVKHRFRSPATFSPSIPRIVTQSPKARNSIEERRRFNKISISFNPISYKKEVVIN